MSRHDDHAAHGEDALRAVLRSRADEVAPSHDAYARLAARVAEIEPRRRRRWWGAPGLVAVPAALCLLAAAAAVVLLVGGQRGGASGSTRCPHRPRPHRPPMRRP